MLFFWVKTGTNVTGRLSINWNYTQRNSGQGCQKSNVWQPGEQWILSMLAWFPKRKEKKDQWYQTDLVTWSYPALLAYVTSQQNTKLGELFVLLFWFIGQVKLHSTTQMLSDEPSASLEIQTVRTINRCNSYIQHVKTKSNSRLDGNTAVAWKSIKYTV